MTRAIGAALAALLLLTALSTAEAARGQAPRRLASIERVSHLELLADERAAGVVGSGPASPGQ